MAVVAKWLTHQIVALALGGSIPLDRPILQINNNHDLGESPSGKATDFDSVMRRFDPFLPSHEPLAQLVEHLTFNQGVEGSSPSWLTIFKLYMQYVPLAQLDRAFDYESKGQEFESLRARHFLFPHVGM